MIRERIVEACEEMGKVARLGGPLLVLLQETAILVQLVADLASAEFTPDES